MVGSMTKTTRPLHIGFRLNASEKERILLAAAKSKVPVGTFCREGALEKAEFRQTAEIKLSYKVKRGAPGCTCGKRGRPKASCPFHGSKQGGDANARGNETPGRPPVVSPEGQEQDDSPATSHVGRKAMIPVVISPPCPPPHLLGDRPIPDVDVPETLTQFAAISTDHPEFIDLRTQQLCEQGMTKLAAKRQAQREKTAA
jgi:hypothetical protein